MYKIRLQRYFFWNLQQMGKVTMPFCWHQNYQNFVHKGLSVPAPGYVHVEKTLKNCVKNQNSKRFVWNLQQMVEVIRAFCCHQKFVPKGFSVLAPGLYTCIKSLKMCIKSDFEEIILKLAICGQRENAFLLSSKFCPQWIVCPCPGLYTYGETWKNVQGSPFITLRLESIELDRVQVNSVIKLYFSVKIRSSSTLNTLEPNRRPTNTTATRQDRTHQRASAPIPIRTPRARPALVQILRACAPHPKSPAMVTARYLTLSTFWGPPETMPVVISFICKENNKGPGTPPPHQGQCPRDTRQTGAQSHPTRLQQPIATWAQKRNHPARFSDSICWSCRGMCC